ncbi:hypothetical protein [Paenibacillus hexagrammi]|uniref:CYTH domain-containing protein n=1 Tax=Paenibacillus hexagrammi TaxID=2908839 RepID=A0ABY3SKG4_9BACL|nr:hypothetical protein [Paenibacillus sp. YPD9-1]UJF34010.1 hypothetical protein L0M14_01865 [Paenibacillus sp. YPD9-1]
MMSMKISSRSGKAVCTAALFTILLGTLSLSSYSSPASATPQPAVPDYEVKLFLDPADVLDSNHQLKSSVRTYFGMPSTKTKMSVEYLDTSDLDINDAGWNVRARKLEDYSDDEFQITYKKRYPITNGNIDAALAAAALDGFDAGEDDYEAQVDWGYSKQTLSFSNKKTVHHNGYDGMELLSENDAIDEAISHAPGKFEDWGSNNWGTDKLDDSKAYGPVDAKRWIGTWQNKTMYIEVWEIKKESGSGYDYVVEASFKTPSRTDAANGIAQLQSDLTQQGWFLPTDELKTQMILDRY